MTCANGTLRVGVWPGSSKGGNPFIDLFADGLRGAGAIVVDVEDPLAIDPDKIDVFHIHWPEQLFWAGGGLLRTTRRLVKTLRHLRQIKSAGVPVVWMVHNLEPHDMSRQQRLLWPIYRRVLGSISDGYLTLSPATLELVRSKFPELQNKLSRSVWMPAQTNVIDHPSRMQVRTQFGIDGTARLFAFLGLVRPYKGIETLIDAFQKIREPGHRLLIAGAAEDQDYADKLTELADADPRINLVFRRLTDPEYAGYQAASDVVVLPYHRYLHSSAMVHAISSHTPVVTPDTPFARALRDEVGEDWMEIYDSTLDPEALLACRKPNEQPRLGGLSSAAMGRDVLEFYRLLLCSQTEAKERGFAPLTPSKASL